MNKSVGPYTGKNRLPPSIISPEPSTLGTQGVRGNTSDSTRDILNDDITDITAVREIPKPFWRNPRTIATHMAATLGGVVLTLALQKSPQLTVNVEGRSPTPALPTAVVPPPPPIVAAPVALPPSPPPLASALPSKRKDIGIPPALRNLNLGTELEKQIAEMLGDTSVLNTAGSPSELFIRRRLSIDAEVALNTFRLVDKGALAEFLSTIQVSHKAEATGFINGYLTLLNTELPKDIDTLMREARAEHERSWKSNTVTANIEYDPAEVGPARIAKHSKGKLTPIQVRAHMFRTEYSDQIPDIRKTLEEAKKLLTVK